MRHRVTTDDEPLAEELFASKHSSPNVVHLGRDSLVRRSQLKVQH
jgi:hypothetical protein